jgi:uncharacterized phage-associated protein
MFDTESPPTSPASRLGAPRPAPYPRDMTLSAHAVAAELRARQPGMGALKLHKLLYYCQGHHLASFGEPLFGESISAWDHGPVVGEVWFDEDRGVEPPPSRPLGEAELNTVGYVLSRYGALSGRDLEHLTHSEDPWLWADADRRPRTSTRIPPEWIRDYFRREAQGEYDDVVLDAAAVRDWLRDAGSRRDEPGPRDDPAEIRRRLEELRESLAR